MMNDKHFKKVNLSEFEPDKDKQKVIDDYVGGKQWVLVSIETYSDGDISLEVEGGGGISLEKIPAVAASAALALYQGFSEQEEVDE